MILSIYTQNGINFFKKTVNNSFEFKIESTTLKALPIFLKDENLFFTTIKKWIKQIVELANYFSFFKHGKFFNRLTYFYRFK